MFPSVNKGCHRCAMVSWLPCTTGRSWFDSRLQGRVHSKKSYSVELTLESRPLIFFKKNLFKDCYGRKSVFFSENFLNVITSHIYCDVINTIKKT